MSTTKKKLPVKLSKPSKVRLQVAKKLHLGARGSDGRTYVTVYLEPGEKIELRKFCHKQDVGVGPFMLREALKAARGFEVKMVKVPLKPEVKKSTKKKAA